MSFDSLESIQAFVQQRVTQALAEDAASRGADVPQSGTGESVEGEITVDVDGKGFVRQVRYDDSIAELDADELREATLQAIQAAHADLRPGGRPAKDPTAALHDNSVDQAYRDYFDQRMAGGASGPFGAGGAFGGPRPGGTPGPGQPGGTQTSI
ncbi:hypothetical protein [Occultella gossypii]|uniref:YbaB/EbfC DNA-binding family protein n=1 Tax=Occultella gossypii TaxID=2800820 RepID=A0ABS7SB74_9MICO|nr:hypothetical protein [Occultella gossypii]MBZ2196508.1 hypothetical protein [Occultella gossypii]